MGRIRERRRAAKVPRPADCSQDVDRHCESNLAPPARRAARSFVHPGATPPGAVARDHGLAAGLLARRSWSATAFPGAHKPQVALWLQARCLQLRGQPRRCALDARAPPSLLIPRGNHQAASGKNGVGAKLSQRVVKPSSSISRDVWRGEHKASKWPRPFLNFFTMRGQSFLDSVVCHFAGTQAS
jgi:hypothetical protein